MFLIRDYPGFLLSGVLFVALCAAILTRTRFHASMVVQIERLRIALEEARAEIRRLRDELLKARR